MNQFIHILNEDFQEMLRGKKYDNYHRFFESHEWFIDAVKDWYNDIDTNFRGYEYNGELDIKPSNKKCIYIPHNVASESMLKNIYSTLIDPQISDYSIIKEKLEQLYYYLLPSTIVNIKDYINNINKKDINIIIAGAGPIGLFTALYLNETYNINSPFNVKVNIFMMDNRTCENTSFKNTKMPYIRLTQFGFDIKQIQSFVNQIFCWKNKTISYGTRLFDFINVLENMLYVIALNVYRAFSYF